ncbi:MAG: terminase family protein, partial [bacterium]
MTITIPYRPHPAQKTFHQSNARFRILSSGRRFGKSEAAVNEAIKFAAMHPNSIIWVVAPVFAQSMINWRKFKKFIPPEIIKGAPHLSEKYIELMNGSTIWIKSGDNPDNLRGEGIHFLIIDEAAMVKKEVWEEALRPALSDTAGKAVMISTPKGHNWFFDIWVRGQDSEFPDYQSWSHPTSDNPYIEASEIIEAQTTLPELVYRQEYLAEFLDDIGAVFRGIELCIKGRLTDPVPKHSYIMGVDLAKYTDFTVLCVMNQLGELVYYSRFNQIDWAFQKERIITVANKYNAKIVIDSTGIGDAITEDLTRSGMKIEGYKFTNESKKQLIEGLSIAIEQQRISFPDIPELINELRIFGYTISKTGLIRYNAPPSYHDDCFVKGTLITTPSGQVPIEHLNVGDYVLTREGPKPIVATNKRLASVITKFGLTGTPGHPIFTTKGLISLGNVNVTDKVYTWNQQRFITEIKPIGDIQNLNTNIYDHISGITGLGKNLPSHYIGKYGSTITEVYLMGSLSTIKTGIDSIMNYLISKSPPVKNMDHYTRHRNCDHNQEITSKRIILKYVKLCRMDIGRVNNCGNRGKIILNISKMQKNINMFVSYVIKNITAKELKKPNFAQKNVIRNTLDCPVKTQNTADNTALKMVYNIQVDDVPEYFANSILVHNCVIALSLATYGALLPIKAVPLIPIIDFS